MRKIRGNEGRSTARRISPFAAHEQQTRAAAYPRSVGGKVIAHAEGEIRRQLRVTERVAQPFEGYVLDPVTQREEGNGAALPCALKLKRAGGDHRVGEALAVHEPSRTPAAEKGERLNICKAVVGAFTAGAAVEMKFRAASLKPEAEGKERVGVVLIHRGGDEL